MGGTVTDIEEEALDLQALALGQKTEARLRDRALICWLTHEGKRVSAVVALGVSDATARQWFERLNEHGLVGLRDAPRPGRPRRTPPPSSGR